MRIKCFIHIGLIIIVLAGWPGSFKLSAGNPQSVRIPQSSGLAIAVFDVDATPPVGRQMAYDPVKNTWDLGLRARGIILSGSGRPIVLCSIDWIGIGNESQDEFKRVLSEAAGTTPDRVAVHTVHQHDAPICDFGAEKFLLDRGIDPLGFRSSFTREVMYRLAEPDTLHLHFNGAGGNLGAGKYNDGSRENRDILTEKLADGMKRAWEATKKEPVNPASVAWTVESISLPPAAYQGKLVGLIGDVGCFSLQSSKVFCCGEGGAIVSENEELMDKCYTVMNHGTAKSGRTITIGSKYRMNEFEGAVLLGQMPGLRERHNIRNRNAKYLTEKLSGCPGLVPQKLYDGTTAGSYYLYTWSYKKEHFNNAPREKFLKAVAAEGISLSPYIANGLHKEPWTDHIQTLPEYKTMFGDARLKKFKEELYLPKCDQVCQEMVMLWTSGPLLGTQADMDNLVNAIMKVYDNRDKLNSI